MAYYGPVQAITTTKGVRFSGDETITMARLVYKRFGYDLYAATDAWRRMLQNSCETEDFLALIQALTTKEKTR